MAVIQGFATHAAGAELLPYKYEPGDLKQHEVEIAISHCGVCRSDIHMVDNDWGISQYPFIPGHEIIGKVTVTGSAVLGLNTGDRVGAGWQANSLRALRVVPARRGKPLRRQPGYLRSSPRRICRSRPRQPSLRRSHPGGDGQRAGRSTSLRRGHCLQPDSHLWRQSVLARRGRWHRRTGTHGPAVCPCLWSGGYGLLHLPGQRG